MKNRSGVSSFHRRTLVKQTQIMDKKMEKGLTALIEHKYYGGTEVYRPSYNYNLALRVASLFPVDSLKFYRSEAVRGLIRLTRKSMEDKRTKFLKADIVFSRTSDMVDTVFEGDTNSEIDDLSLFLIKQAIMLYCTLVNGKHRYFSDEEILQALIQIIMAEVWERYIHKHNLKNGKAEVKYCKTIDVEREVYGKILYVKHGKATVDFLNALMREQDNLFDSSDGTQEDLILNPNKTIQERMNSWVVENYPDREYLKTAVGVLTSTSEAELDEIAETFEGKNKDTYEYLNKNYSDMFYRIGSEMRYLLATEVLSMEHASVVKDVEEEADTARRLLKGASSELKKSTAENKRMADVFKKLEGKYEQSIQELASAVRRERETQEAYAQIKAKEESLQGTVTQFKAMEIEVDRLRKEVTDLRSKNTAQETELANAKKLESGIAELAEMHNEIKSDIEDYAYIACESPEATAANDREYEKIRLKRIVLVADSNDIDADILGQFPNSTFIDTSKEEVTEDKIDACDVVVTHTKYEKMPVFQRTDYTETPLVILRVLNSKLMIHKVHDTIMRGVVI